MLFICILQKCTYIEVEQVSHTYATILSKPAWMWGAEMGSNEHGVCIGNEAVWTHLNGPEDEKEKLLGMDLLRLGLERASTALEAVKIIADLLEKYGQGGQCSDVIQNFTYHNSFLIADRQEAWVLETAGELWAAERISSGVRNISNELSIGTKIDLMSSQLKAHAHASNLWNPESGPFSFKKAYGDSDSDDSYRYKCGRHLLTKLSASGEFSESNMFQVLRDKSSGICMSSGSFVTTGSQVSVLSPMESNKPCCHWFTATPNPEYSIFKPFIFTCVISFSPFTVAPTFPESQDPAKIKPRFQTRVNRSHILYKLHKKACTERRSSQQGGKQLKKELRAQETDLVASVQELMLTPEKLPEFGNLFQAAVECEIQLYQDEN